MANDECVTILMAQASGQPLCTISRGAGSDIVRGTPDRDVICTGAGNDIVYGFGGDDVIRAGPATTSSAAETATTITPNPELPDVDDPVTIDGYTEALGETTPAWRFSR